MENNNNTGPELHIQNVTAEKHANVKDKVKFSGFHITISTNKRPQTEDDADALRMQLNVCIANTFTHPNLKEFIAFLSEEQQKGHTYVMNIKDVDVQYAIELGSDAARGGRIHAHVVLKISHTSRIKIDIPVFKAKVTEYLNMPGARFTVPNPYIHIVVMRNSKNLEEYLLKEPVSVQAMKGGATHAPPAAVDNSAVDSLNAELANLQLK
jgi:hypothetical protein